MTNKNKIAAVLGHANAWLRRRLAPGARRRFSEASARIHSRLDELQLLPSVIEEGRAFRYAANAAACLCMALTADWALRFHWPTPAYSALLHLPGMVLFIALFILRRQRTARYELAERIWFLGLASGAIFLPWSVYLLDSSDELALAQSISGALLLLFIYPLRPALLCFSTGLVPAIFVVFVAWLNGHSFKIPTASLFILLNVPAWVFLRIYSDRETKDKVFAVKITTSTIAHEMRTPMFSIEASCEAMRQTFKRFQVKTLSPEQRDNPYTQMTIRTMLQSIDRIEDESARMNGSLNLLLQNASSPKSIPSDTTLSPSIESLIKKIVSGYPFFGEADLENIQMIVKEDFAVWISPGMLELVITNLLKNALHSIQKADKGKITIHVERMCDARFNILRFKDTGSGMSKSTLSQIFVPFYTTRSNGNGLGLPFSRKALALFGSDISAHSVENEFAEFTIRFPNVDHRINNASTISPDDNRIG